MNQWGIPDWRNPSSYGDVKRWGINRWRWEFYRRRDDLREFFDRWAEISFKENLEVNDGYHLTAPGFLAFGKGEDAEVAIKKFGYDGVPNPRFGFQPALAIRPHEQVVGRLRHFNPWTRKPYGISILDDVMCYSLELERNQYAIIFELDKPITPQVNDAINALKDSQKKLHGKLIKRTQHQEKWLIYLRTLDARAENIPWSEIASIDMTTAQTPHTASG